MTLLVLLVVLVQDALAYLGSLRVFFLCSWLGVGESLVLLQVSLNFFQPSDFRKKGFDA